MRVIIGAAAMVFCLMGCASQGPTPRTYIVFFSAGSAELSPDATKIVNLAAAEIRSTHPALIVIASEPSTVTAPGYDPKLAEPRFTAVERGLIAEGVDSKSMARAELTDLEAKVGTTGDRRIEIRLLKSR